jgi:two-component sensor histidine kinase
MQRALRDGPSLIEDLWRRQFPLVSQSFLSADLGELVNDLHQDTPLSDVLRAMCRQLCRRLAFRRSRLWLLQDGDLTLACSWPPDSRAARPGKSDRLALRGSVLLSAGHTPKSLSIPLRGWSGEVCGVVHLECPVLDHVLAAHDLALADRYGDIASSGFHRAQLAQMLIETQRLLDSKTVAVRESHHRIKNNLQAVAGLLQATGVRAHSRRVREALGESAARVKAIAAVHEALLVDGGSETDLRTLVDTLMRCAFLPLLGPETRIQIRTDVQPCRLPARRASSLALVINELVTNALNHAFPENRGEVSLTYRCDGEAVLTVADDGGALPLGPLDESRFGLGLHIVHSIVCKDLGGSFQIAGGPQTVATARFPLPDITSVPSWTAEPASLHPPR